MLSSLPPNRSPMSFSSLGTFRSNIFATNPSTNTFLPLSLPVPPMASTVSDEMGTPTWRYSCCHCGRLHVVAVIQNDAALSQGLDMVFVRMLVKRDQQVRLVARAQHFTRADAHLENGRSARNGGRDRHEGHDLLFAPSGQSRQKAADGLNTVLGIACYPNDRFGDLRDSRSAARRGGGESGCVHERIRLTVLMSVGSFARALEIVEGAKPMQGHTNIARLAVKRLSETVSV